MKKKTILKIGIPVAIAAVILGFFLIKNGKSDQPQYRTEALAKGDLESIVTTSGTISPINTIDIGSQVSGKIIRLLADFNSQVKAGQVVAELDQELLRAKVEQDQSSYESALASLEQAKANMDNAKKKNERTQDLFSRNLVSFEEKETAEANNVGARVGVQTAQARVSQAKSQLESSKVNLAYAIIRSPIDGTVIDRQVNVGQTVAASFTAPVLFKVASDLTQMQVQCAVDEADIGKVKEGQNVRFTVDAFTGETFTGRVSQVRYAAVTTSNVVTYTTIVNAANPDIKLRPGMTATVSIITGEAKGVLRVPNTALRFTPNLPQEELQKLMASMRPGQGGPRSEGQTGAAATAAPTAGQSAAAGGRTFDMSQLTPEQIQRFQQMRAQGGRRQGGVVWVLDDQNQIKPYPLRPGLTDNTYTEVVRGELKEGMKIIIGFQGSTPATQTQQQGRPGGPGMMMFR